MRNHISILFFLSTIVSYAQTGEKTYTELISEIQFTQEKYKTEYQKSDASGKDSIIKSARAYLLHTLTSEVFLQWYGTPWGFNGTSRTPKEGKIACGYFVTNILSDIGFQIPRVKWAQSPSEVFIKKLSFNTLKRFSDTHILDVTRYLKACGNGLYLVGLDVHVGFVYVNDDQIHFIHADYYEPEIGVVSEPIDSNNPLNDSSYRVFGKLMSDKMILHWINAIPF